MTARSIRIVVALVLALSLMTGCSWFQPDGDSGDNDGDYGVGLGSLKIVLDGELAQQSIEPPLDMAIASYLITLSGPGDTVTETIQPPDTSVVIHELQSGVWTVTVNARNGDDPPVVIAAGEVTATVITDETASADITVLPVDGEGTLDISFEWPDALLNSPTVVASLTPHSGSSQDISSGFTIDTGGSPDLATYTGSWDAGYYTLAVSLRDNGAQVWGDVIAVRIIAAEASVGNYSLSESELDLVAQSGAVEVNLGADLQNPYTIVFTGTQPEVGQGEDMTVTASLDPPSTPESFEWYLNGTLASGVGGDTIVIGPSGVSLSPGLTYQLAVAVHDGPTISTAGFSFRVTSAAETGLIAYESQRTGDSEVFTMYADGSNTTQMTDNDGVEYDVSWSPDGSRLAFVSVGTSGFDIFVMDADGSNIQQVTDDSYANQAPTWSPDGTRIAFSSDRGHGGEIFVVDDTGNNLGRLTNNTAIDDEPAWSPNDTLIAFTSDRDGEHDIYTMDVNGENVQQLTTGPEHDTFPAWSPDGSQIAYTRVTQLLVMDNDGSNERVVFDPGVVVISPTWSPNGGRLASAASIGGSPAAGYEIVVVDVDGSDMQRITNNNVADRYPTWRAYR